MKLFTIAMAGALLVPAGMVAKDIRAKVAAVAENQLVKEVRHELLMLPNVTVFDDFAFSVADSPGGGAVVTLTGSVTRPVLHASAVNVVRHVEGVDAVVDKIELLVSFTQR